MNIQNSIFGPEKESKDKPVTEPETVTNDDQDKEDPRRTVEIGEEDS